MRTILIACALALCSAAGCSSKGDCQACKSECGNGVVITCVVSGASGCGSQPVTQFCPNGCSPTSSSQCSATPVDGAAGLSCAASSVTIQKGALAEQGTTSVAVTSFLTAQTRVVVATSAKGACASTTDAGVGNGSSGEAALTLLIPLNYSGQSSIGAGASATLTSWNVGTSMAESHAATSGTIFVSLNQPGGGTIGSYDLVFSGGEERGAFVAPVCDICTLK